MVLMNKFPLAVTAMQTAYYWHHCWKDDRRYLRCMVRYFCALHSLRRQLTWRCFAGHAGDCPQRIPDGAFYVFGCALQLHSGYYPNQLNTGCVVWNFLILGHAGTGVSPLLVRGFPWYVTPCSSRYNTEHVSRWTGVGDIVEIYCWALMRRHQLGPVHGKRKRCALLHGVLIADR